MGHSRSPAMHNAAFRELGIDAVYQLLPIPPELFDETVRALPQSGFGGINVTIPHKGAAARLADHRSAAVEAIGAANTLSFRAGEIHADNTDAPALAAALGPLAAGTPALLLGAGGTARAALWALKSAGADVQIQNRTHSRAEQLAAEFGATASAQTAGGHDFALIVNTTSVGMDPAVDAEAVLDQLALERTAIGPETTLVDFVYRPGGSALAALAAAAGARVIDGEELLARQGALAFEIWFDRSAPLETMRAAITA